MENNGDFLLTITTLAVALISLLGNALHYIFPTRRGKSEEEFDMAKTLESITGSYDKLFENLKEKILALEEEVRISKEVITELTAIKEALEIRVREQEKRLEEQTEELSKMKDTLDFLKQEKEKISA